MSNTLATILFNEVQKININFPSIICQSIIKPNILSIDDVMCDISFKFYSNSIILIINSKHIVNNNSCCEYIELYHKSFPLIDINITDIKLKDCLTNYANLILETIPKLKLDMCGNLSLHTNNYDVTLELNNIFASLSNVVVDRGDECCVCSNTTYTKTPCKHSLCYRCWFKLGKTDAECPEDELNFSCPICRECINWVESE